MSGIQVFYTLFIIIDHWFADFLLQTENMALNKSKSNYWLLQHVKAYAIGMIPSAILTMIVSHSILMGLLWHVVNVILHLITDYCTSRWSSKLYALKQFYSPNKYLKFVNFPAFFSVIGLDQVIHYTCLFVSFCLVT